MEQIIEEAKAEFVRAKDRIAHALATTPDDRINWSPSSNARTPVQLVAHAALAIPGLTDLLIGKPFPFATIPEADQAFREMEKRFDTREQVLDLLDRNSTAYLAWMDMLTPEQLSATVTLPFGSVPMAIGVTLMANHIRNHTAQIDYIQTIYGDHDWYM